MSTIHRRLKELRTLIDTSEDPVEQRIAYAMEMAIRWTVEDTEGWPTPANEARELAYLLRQEITQ